MNPQKDDRVNKNCSIGGKEGKGFHLYDYRIVCLRLDY